MSYSRQLNTTPFLLLSIFVLLLITGCNSSSKKKIGVNGGVVSSNDGLLKLIIPAGALLNDTEISLKSITPSVEIQSEGLKRFYQAKPEGLTFATPAILEADVSEFFDSPTLPIILTASITEGGQVLGNQEINTDFENGTSTIRGEVNHFSTFSVVRSEFTVEMRGVPLASPANNPINSIQLFTSIKEAPSFLQEQNTISLIDKLNYFDISTAPVFFDETSNPVNILQELGREIIFASSSLFNRDVTFPLDYHCGDPGFGEFAGVVSIGGRVAITTSQIEDVFAFVPGMVAEENVRTTRRVPFTQTLLGKRTINCAGEETTEPTDPPEEPEDPPVEPTSSLSIDQSEISFIHIRGVTECPQQVATVTITNNGTASTDVSLSSSTIALSADTASFSLAPAESKEVTISFTCNPPESFVGTINFTGNNTSITLTVNGVIQ